MYIPIWVWPEIEVCRGPPLCYKPWSRALCYKPLSWASVWSAAVFNRLVAGRVCRKIPDSITSLVAKGRPGLLQALCFGAAAIHIYIYMDIYVYTYINPCLCAYVYVYVYALYQDMTPCVYIYICIKYPHIPLPCCLEP